MNTKVNTKMSKNFAKLISAAALAAALPLTALAADGGIVDVDTRLNVRESASLSSAVKTRLWDGQVITLHYKEGNFWYTEYAPNSFGYVSADYVDTLELKSGRVTTASTQLNVRAAASASAGVKDKLSKGEDVLILGTYGDFYKVLYRGNLVGYASKAYITLDGEGNVSNGNFSAVKLSLPSYKQYNYKSLRLPGSGESVATHGCAVTSLAMTESFRLGRTVTPKSVIAEQRFTSTGALYWPSEYSVGDTSLYFIYSRLKSGSPVIIHVKTNGGTSHFAVINGFSGGNLDAKNFSLLDPGSATRQTLAGLLKDYPNIVKTLSYQ